MTRLHLKTYLSLNLFYRHLSDCVVLFPQVLQDEWGPCVCSLMPNVLFTLLVDMINLHVSLVIIADLLDADVVLGLDVWFGGGVGAGKGHDAGDVLEVLLVLHFDLRSDTSLVSS